MAKPSISMPDELLEEVDERVGPDRSGWIREAIAMRLFIDDVENERDNLPEEWWQDAIDAYLDDREQPASIEA